MPMFVEIPLTGTSKLVRDRNVVVGDIYIYHIL